MISPASVSTIGSPVLIVVIQSCVRVRRRGVVMVARWRRRRSLPSTRGRSPSCGSGALVSNIGTWMETVALAYYVADTTGKPSWSAIVAAAGFIPAAIVGPVGSAMADRLDRRRVLITTNALAALIAAIARDLGRQRQRHAGRDRRALLRGRRGRRCSGSRRSRRRCPTSSHASTSSPPSGCRTRSGTWAASSVRRSPRWR